MNFKTINAPNLLNHFSGDEEILLEMIHAFQNGVYNLLNPIRESIVNQDGDQLRINAHTFKGILKSFYAEEGSVVAYELELRGLSSKFEDALVILNKFENQLMLLLYDLQFLQKKLNTIS